MPQVKIKMAAQYGPKSGRVQNGGDIYTAHKQKIVIFFWRPKPPTVFPLQTSLDSPKVVRDKPTKVDTFPINKNVNKQNRKPTKSKLLVGQSLRELKD